MFLAVYDPEWLQAAHARCLWDGHATPPGELFCSEACAEQYADWRDRVARLPIGRQPAMVDIAEWTVEDVSHSDVDIADSPEWEEAP
jgi:predicted nucleic acid-binding Zn ribbon protein